MISTEVIGFDKLKEEYPKCPDFSNIYQALQQGSSSEHKNYTLQEGYLFKDNQLCIP